MSDLVVAAPAELAGAAVAGELVDQALVELPVLAELERREQLLVAAWLMSLRSPWTRRAYAGRAWLGWLAERGINVLAAQRVHVDLWVRQQQDAGAEASSVPRRLSALSNFYRYLAGHDLVTVVPTAGGLARYALLRYWVFVPTETRYARGIPQLESAAETDRSASHGSATTPSGLRGLSLVSQTQTL